MRPLETAILILDFVAILGLSLRGSALRRLVLVPGLAVGLTLAHLVLEHYRWQMAPAYLLTGVLFAVSWPRLTGAAEVKSAGKRSPPGWRLALGGLGVAWLALAAALPLVLPVPQLPPPPGPFKVGTAVFDWVDDSRPETYSSHPSDRRELMVQIWYPAAPATGAQTGPWIDHFDIAAPIIARDLDLPAFALDHLALVATHTYPEAPVLRAEGPFPVIVYSHGYTGFRDEALNQMEALASSGYLVAGIDHPYGAMFTIFPDGRVVVNDPTVLPAGDQRASERLEATFAADERFVLDQLEGLNAGKGKTMFAGLLDMGRVGLLGYSTGGGAIVWTCSLDSRCRAGMALDPWVEPLPQGIVSRPLAQPFLFMRSERTTILKPENYAIMDRLYREARQDHYRLMVRGTMHMDWTLAPLLTPISGLIRERGALEGQRTLQVVTDYILAFFNQYLKHAPSPLLNGASPHYPEVVFESQGL